MGKPTLQMEQHTHTYEDTIHELKLYMKQKMTRQILLYLYTAAATVLHHAAYKMCIATVT